MKTPAPEGTRGGGKGSGDARPGGGAAELPGLGPAAARPRVNPRIDVAAVVHSPEEYFVLSRIDGRTSYEELVRVSGLDAKTTLALLRRFKQQGVISDPEAPAGAPRAETPTPSAPPVVEGRSRTEKAGSSVLARLDDGSPVDPAALAPGADLAPETKARILRLHRRLKTIAPHELLGVPADAQGTALKRAYFLASKELHPDRFFGKDVGPFGALLGDVFAALKSAFETLEAAGRKK